MMEAKYCLCGKGYDPEVFMIQCDACKEWFHGSCCNVQEHTALEIDKYYCPQCTGIFGPTTMKPYLNFHRHNYWEENVADKPVQTGTKVFIRELRARHFSSEGEVVLHAKGSLLNEAFLAQNGFDSPIVVDQKDGLEMIIPPETFTIFDVESYIGGDFEIDVIDVIRQTGIKMKLRDFIEYYNSTNRSRVFNVVSLEFSLTDMTKVVEAPSLARKLDWVNYMWPDDAPVEKPHVQKYCLMSVRDSYTDFHIDFGGTSVWYHVLKGEKIFYLIRPTTANLTLYQHWMTSSNQSETFFGDQVDSCYKCTLREGQTMFIPTGWIHAVLTPVDSLVFGGNFLHSYNIPMQLQVYEIEKRVKTTAKFLYPSFEMMNWYAAHHILLQVHELNTDERKCPNHLLVGLKTLLSAMKQWNTDKDYNLASRDQIPMNVCASRFFKEVAKVIRQAEKYLNTLNPPKPERESKRKRRKPVNKDFVDYSQSKASLEFLTVESFQIENTTPAPASSSKLPPAALLLERQQSLLRQTEVINTYREATDVRPAETTAVHRGGTVLKIKLGSKDIGIIGNSQEKQSITIPTANEKSIYDFHDDSDRDEDCLKIDEAPQKKKAEVKAKHGWLQRKQVQGTTSLETELLPKNGIESLLKASALTNSQGTGRASPSTQEAIAGMLSISQTFIQPGKGSKARKHKLQSRSDDEDDDLGNVHQDEDYVYPSLDNSDDDDIHIFKPRGRSKVDEAWNPKARVGPLLPKMNRPAREGTKKQAVEKVLEAAAAKRSNAIASDSPDKSPKRQYRKKKVKPKVIEKTGSLLNGPSTSATTLIPQPVLTPQRPRKGMKTAKQRLGKILKIHKMIH